jgi:ElaB/YqjD/DUF883 family membrane-anchored ribosome-binding protein
MDETAKRIKEQVNQVQEVYEDGRQAATDFAKSASEASKRALSATDEWVHENPWVALGAVAGVGLLVGILIAQCVRGD